MQYSSGKLAPFRRAWRPPSQVGKEMIVREEEETETPNRYGGICVYYAVWWEGKTV
jgi:hypothetical protein